MMKDKTELEQHAKHMCFNMAGPYGLPVSEEGNSVHNTFPLPLTPFKNESQTDEKAIANAKSQAGINIAGIERDIDNLVSGLDPHPEHQQPCGCQAVLYKLLAQIGPVDFRRYAELEPEEKISRKLYIVIVIDTLLDIAVTNNWGLCTRNRFIYVYNSTYWQVIGADDFRPFLAQAAQRMGVPAFDARYHLFKDELYKQFLSCSNLPEPETGNGIYINLQNGTFEISADKQILREARREDFLRYQLGFSYDPQAQCPLFFKYLDRVLPDKECQQVIAEYLGYIFTTGLKLEKALILYGNGANDKSVFFEIVNALLGDENICSYSLQGLTKAESYQRAELSNKLLNYSSEISGKLDVAVFKQLVSGEPVEVRHIYGRPFIMKQYSKLLFNCNELPHNVEQTHAFFRRFLIIPFKVTIPESEQDPQLAAKIIACELSGIFNWILVELKRIVSHKRFTYSDAINSQLTTYRRDSDSVALFMDESDYRSTKGSPNTLLKTMYADYQAYCFSNGYKACSNRTFVERLRALAYSTEKNRNGILIHAARLAVEDT